MNKNIPRFNNESERSEYARKLAIEWVNAKSSDVIEKYGREQLIADATHENLMALPECRASKLKQLSDGEDFRVLKQSTRRLTTTEPQAKEHLGNSMKGEASRLAQIAISKLGKKPIPKPSLIGKSAQENGKALASAMVANLKKRLKEENPSKH